MQQDRLVRNRRVALRTIGSQRLFNISSAKRTNRASFEPVHQTILMKYVLARKLVNPFLVKVGQTNRTGFLLCSVRFVHVFLRLEVVHHEFVALLCLCVTAF